MRTYAYIEDGKVSQLVLPYVNPEGLEVPIEERFTPEVVSQMVDITDLDPWPEPGWTYDGSVFAAPVPYQPTPADILLQNQRAQEYFLSQASQAMTPILLELQLEGTDEATVRARAWRDYYHALEAVDLTVASPDWPTSP